MTVFDRQITGYFECFTSTTEYPPLNYGRPAQPISREQHNARDTVCCPRRHERTFSNNYTGKARIQRRSSMETSAVLNGDMLYIANLFCKIW
jgi:hypothetical protein